MNYKAPVKINEQLFVLEKKDMLEVTQCATVEEMEKLLDELVHRDVVYFWRRFPGEKWMLAFEPFKPTVGAYAEVERRLGKALKGRG